MKESVGKFLEYGEGRETHSSATLERPGGEEHGFAKMQSLQLARRNACGKGPSFQRLRQQESPGV